MGVEPCRTRESDCPAPYGPPAPGGGCFTANSSLSCIFLFQAIQLARDNRLPPCYNGGLNLEVNPPLRGDVMSRLNPVALLLTLPLAVICLAAVAGEPDQPAGQRRI